MGLWRRNEPTIADSIGFAAAPALPWSLQSRLHLFGTLFLTLSLPLAGLAWLVASQAKETLRTHAGEENRTTARLAALLVREHFDGLKRFVAGVADLEAFRESFAEHDVEEVRRLMELSLRHNPAFDRAFVTDSKGNEWADWPPDSKTFGKNFAFRDWYKGVTRTNETYISEAYLRLASPRVDIFSVATPVLDSKGKLSGYLIAQHPTSELSTWLAQTRPSPFGTLALVDPKGVLAVGASDKGISSTMTAIDRHEVKRALSGYVGTLRGPDLLTSEQSLISYTPVPLTGWTVLAGQPVSAIDAPASELAWTVAALSLATLLAMFTLGAFWLGTIRGFDVALAERSEQLLKSNAELTQIADDLEVTSASVRKAHEDLQRAHHELQLTETHLIQAEKLTALGQLVAGVAHEINNPLAFVTNNLAVLQREVGYLQELIQLHQQAEFASEDVRPAMLEQIRVRSEEIDLPYMLEQLPGIMTRSRDGLKRIQQIVKDLRNFARLDEADLTAADLNEGIRFTLLIVKSKANERGITLRSELEEIPTVYCHPAKVNQVVLNLVSNAIDACNDHEGEVIVRTKPSKEGGAIVEVLDNGHGIDGAILGKIFDPFFTTKRVGQGTGLGLSISYGIMKAHGGQIDVESQVGQGTRFVVSLPATPPEGAEGTKSWVVTTPGRE